MREGEGCEGGGVRIQTDRGSSSESIQGDSDASSSRCTVPDCCTTCERGEIERAKEREG